MARSRPSFGIQRKPAKNLPLSLISPLRWKKKSGQPTFQESSPFLFLATRCPPPSRFGLLCSPHRPVENQGSSNGLPRVGGLRTSTRKGESNQGTDAPSPPLSLCCPSSETDRTSEDLLFSISRGVSLRRGRKKGAGHSTGCFILSVSRSAGSIVSGTISTKAFPWYVRNDSPRLIGARLGDASSVVASCSRRKGSV